MNKIADYEFRWRPRYGGVEAVQQVQIFRNVQAHDAVVLIITEHPNNPGRSVTNGIEEIATLVINQQRLSPFTTTVVEHYTYNDGDPDTWDGVRLQAKDGEMHSAQWTSITWEQVAERIGAVGKEWSEL